MSFNARLRTIKDKNVVIGDYLENADYKALSDPDKAIHMWTSKFHKHLNAILRDHSFHVFFLSL